jgi:hypothetical protein
LLPSQKSTIEAAYGEVLRAEIGQRPNALLTTTRPTADNAARSGTTIDAFVQEK